MFWALSWSRVRAGVEETDADKWELCIVGRDQVLKKTVDGGGKKWHVTFPECLGVSSWPKRSQIQNKKVCFFLHRKLLTSFKPGPSTRYFICQLWNITNTCQMFNNPALLCLSLSNNTLLGAWFREAIVRRMRMGGKAACQKREKNGFYGSSRISVDSVLPPIYRCHSLAGGISSRECSLSIA